jgi:hypothetical protein
VFSCAHDNINGIGSFFIVNEKDDAGDQIKLYGLANF